MHEFTLAIEPWGKDKVILEKTKCNLTKSLKTDDLKEALETFIRRCEKTCKLIDVSEADTGEMISLIVQTQQDALQFAHDLERLIHTSLHEKIYVNVVTD